MESDKLTFREPIYFHSVAKPIAFEDYKPINYPPVQETTTTTNSKFQNNNTYQGNQINLDEHITIDENGEPISDGLISFFNP